MVEAVVITVLAGKMQQLVAFGETQNDACCGGKSSFQQTNNSTA